MLIDVQRLLVLALRQPDPRAWLLAELPSHHGLDDAERTMLAALPDDGLRLTRMLVRKLRLQRLLTADADAARRCTDEPERFAREFAAYDAAEPWHAVFPSEEARAFGRVSGQPPSSAP